MTGKDNDLYLYYLQLESKLDNAYISLAANLKSYNITLVPINCSELDYFINGHKIPLIALIDTIERYRRFKVYRQQFLDFALRNQRLHLFHLDSYGEMKNMISYEKTGHYIRMPLPIHLDQVVETLIDHHFSKQVLEKKWPGGTRVGLSRGKV